MNTKDREYIQQLNNSLAKLSEKITKLGLTMAEAVEKMDRLSEICLSSQTLRVTNPVSNEQINATIVKMASEPYDYDPITGRDTPATTEIVEIPPTRESSVENFAMNGSSKMKQIKKEISVSTNKFADDGSMHKDEVNQTPEIKLTDKGSRKKFQKVEQNCSRCSKSFLVHPQHARDNFACDNCLKR